MRTPIGRGTSSGSGPWLAGLLLLVCLLPGLSGAADSGGSSPRTPRVLIINSYHFGYNWSDGEMRGLLHTLVAHYPGLVPEVEFLDWRRHPDADREPGLVEGLVQKHASEGLDLIITLDDPAFDLVRKHRVQLGLGVPVVFGGLNYFDPASLRHQPKITGLEQTYDVQGTLDLMAKLHPNARRVLVVHCATESGEAIRRQIERHENAFEGRFSFEHFTGWTAAGLLERVAGLDDSWLVLLGSMYRDAAGRVLTDDAVFGEAFVNKSRVPVYFFAPPIETHYQGEGWNHAVWQGLGGSLMSAEAHGRQIGELACRVLGGEEASGIPVSTETKSALAMDYRKMQRFGLELSDLPESAEVYFRPMSMYRDYRRQILLSLSAIGILSVLVLALSLSVLRRRRVEAALRLSNERFSLLARATNDLVWDWNLGTGELWWNESYRQVMGLGEDHTPDLEQWRGHIASRDRERVLLDLNRCIESQASQWWAEYHFTKAGGGEGILLSRAYIMRGPDGSALRIIGSMLDVTERRKLEWERTRLAAAFAQSSELIAVLATDGTITYVNPAFQSITGYEPHETADRAHDFILKPGQNGTVFPEIASRVATAGSWTRRVECVRKGGGVYNLHVTITAIHGSSSYAEGYLLIGRDITRELRLEEQARLSQKMEAVGLLAGGVAHDFNNLLQVINGYLQILAEPGLAESERIESTTQIREAARRASQLTRQLLLFSRRQTMEPEHFDLGALSTEFLKMMRRVIGEGISVEFTQKGPSCGVHGDKGQIEQVLLNLCVNARDAMPNGGRLVVTVERTRVSDAFCELHPWAKPGDYVTLEVSDNGCGMDKDTLARIYEPFFSTKPKEKGTGLGLSMVYGIVQRHGGFLHVYSEPGFGSTFRVYLPAAEPAAALETPTPAALTQIPAGSGLILVAEDDPTVRKLVLRLLEKAGYELLCAEDGEQAVRLFEQHKDRLDLVMLDAVMPKLNGREVYARIVATRPELPVLFSSGYGPEMLQPEPMQTPLCQMIQKPYDLELLPRKVAQMLKDARI